MNEKFVVSTNESGAIIVTDVEKDRVYFYDTISDFFGLIRLLNEQQATIEQLQDLCGESDSENAKLRIENKKLKAKLKEKEEDERLYANEILELRETNKEHIKFKSLGGDY